MEEYASRYDKNDEAYDPDAHIVELINDLRRDAEGLKLDGKYSQFGLKLIAASDAMKDLLDQNDQLLESLLQIEDVVSKVLR